MASEEEYAAPKRRLRCTASTRFMADTNATALCQPNGRGVFYDTPLQGQSVLRGFRAAPRETSYSLTFILGREDTKSTGEETATDEVRYTTSRAVTNPSAAALPQSEYPYPYPRPHPYPSSSFSSAGSSDERLDVSVTRRREGSTGPTTPTTTTTLPAQAAAVALDSDSSGPRKRRRRPMSSKEKRIARQCSVDGCENYTIDRGLCFRHGVRLNIFSSCPACNELTFPSQTRCS
jgi:hypothetical protein